MVSSARCLLHQRRVGGVQHHPFHRGPPASTCRYWRSAFTRLAGARSGRWPGALPQRKAAGLDRGLPLPPHAGQSGCAPGVPARPLQLRQRPCGQIRGTVGPREPAQVTALLAAGAVGPLSSRLRELGATIISTAQLDQQGLRPADASCFTSTPGVTARARGADGRVRLRVGGGMGLVVPAASLSEGSGMFSSRSSNCSMAFDASALVAPSTPGASSADSKACLLRRLAQQFSAGALAQRSSSSHSLGVFNGTPLMRATGAAPGTGRG